MDTFYLLVGKIVVWSVLVLIAIWGISLFVEMLRLYREVQKDKKWHEENGVYFNNGRTWVHNDLLPYYQAQKEKRNEG